MEIIVHFRIKVPNFVQAFLMSSYLISERSPLQFSNEKYKMAAVKN